MKQKMIVTQIYYQCNNDILTLSVHFAYISESEIHEHFDLSIVKPQKYISSIHHSITDFLSPINIIQWIWSPFLRRLTANYGIRNEFLWRRETEKANKTDTRNKATVNTDINAMWNLTLYWVLGLLKLTESQTPIKGETGKLVYIWRWWWWWC